jgi:hypothetical protein
VSPVLHPPVYLADDGLCTTTICISEPPRQLSPRTRFAH